MIFDFFDASILVKYAQLVEMIRVVVLWTIWLERNNLCFNTVEPKSIKTIGIRILSLVHF
jgi:hypothetical protein